MQINNEIQKPLYRYWNCIGFENIMDDHIINNKPFKFEVGSIPLITWQNDDKKLVSTLNACKHMGSKLDSGSICNGNLYCPYHGIKHTIEDSCGIIKKHDGKIWWSYNPIDNNIPTIPYFNDSTYVSTYLTFDMKESLPFCIYNSLDLNHPEFVHNGLGFGSNIAPENYKTYLNNPEKLGISFDYITKSSIKAINYDMKIKDRTANYNEVIYPSTSWSKVSSINDIEKNIIIGVSMLPLKENLTRWYITLRHNYMSDIVGKEIMKHATKYILNQDKSQFEKQIKNNKLKEFISWRQGLKYEYHMIPLRNYYNDYKFPSIDDFIIELSKDNW
tara:strand:- start:3455 stop:4447 length:993 start_codon:yes stop_codon:yes gene_type:complete